MQSYKHGLLFLALLAISLATLTGCGGSGGGNVVAAKPVFTSAPVTAALESSAYSYTVAATAPDGSPVNYALTTAPTGATLSGDTISWTPTPAQSRTGNNFAVTATSGAGGTATQSWTVSPNGTVQVTDAANSWGPGGLTALPPISWSETYPAASLLVPQADGLMVAIYGFGDSNGLLSFENVPAGYFWLSINGIYYWTSSSNIDFGTDVSEANTSAPSLPNASTTILNLNFTGLDSTANPSLLGFDTVPTSIGLEATVQDESSFSWTDAPPSSTTTTTSTTTIVTLQADLSQIQNGFAIQQEPTNLGPLPGYVLGPAVELSGLSLQNNTTDTINVTLTPSPQVSLPLEIDVSQWTSLFSNAAPTAPTQTSSPFSLQVQPYVTGPNVASNLPSITSESTACTPTTTPGPCVPIPPTIWTFSGPLPLGLFWPAPVTTTTSVFSSFALQEPPVCYSGLVETQTLSGSGFCGGTATTCASSAIPAAPLLSSDTDFGTIQYGDPFPAAWNRVFHFCQQASLPLPSLTSTTTLDSLGDTQTITWSYGLLNSQSTAPPSSAVVPLLSPVVNPTINGASLFTPATLDTRAVSLSWSAPALGKPYGYRVQATTLPQTISTVSIALPVSRTLYTGRTSLTIPPELLTSGTTYLFDITALMDARANVETSPRRSALPTAAANVVSAPITISTSAP